MEMPKREDLMWMLSEISEDALHYCWQAITYAYFWTDYVDPDRLTDTDVYRLNLIGAAANWNDRMVEELDRWKRVIERINPEAGI